MQSCLHHHNHPFHRSQYNPAVQRMNTLWVTKSQRLRQINLFDVKAGRFLEFLDAGQQVFLQLVAKLLNPVDVKWLDRGGLVLHWNFFVTADNSEKVLERGFSHTLFPKE